MIRYTCVSTKEELEQILKLQKANLPTSISIKEKNIEGFVTVKHDMEILSNMNDIVPHILAKDESKVIGYALCMHPKFAERIAILKPLFSKIESLIKKETKYIVMGQICIEKEYRKKGIFRKLYRKMKKSMAPDYSTIITQVDSVNTRSLQAHYTIGFKLLKSYKADNHNWELIIWR